VPTAYVIFPDGTRVRVEVADTDRARGRGLMFRDAVPENEGMLFVFDTPDRYGFWMKNVRAPLDIVWLDDQYRVVWIVQNAAPCDREPCPTYVPETAALFVVELTGGFARRHGVAVGDALAVSLPR
jgi:uncharacterized protein